MVDSKSDDHASEERPDSARSATAEVKVASANQSRAAKDKALSPTSLGARRLDRRSALRLTGLFATAGFVSYVGYHLLFGEPSHVILAILRRRLGYLNLPEDSLEPFARDFVAEKGEADSLRKSSVLALPLRVFSPYEWLELRHSLRRLEDSVVSKFLLSTDFFLYGGDEGRPIQYLSYYDPYTAPCRNPFARPVDAGGG